MNAEKNLSMTSHDSERGDRHPRQPEGGRPTAEGTPQPDAPGGGGRDPGAWGTPDPFSEVEAPGEDGRGLGAWAAGPFVIGSVDEVNGLGAEEVPGYPLTRFELLVLARHWAKEELDLRLFWFFTACTGSTEYRTMAYADRRLDRIADLLGPDAVKGIIAEVEEEARRGMGDEEWRVFTEGTDQEWDQVRERSDEELDYLHRQCEDKETQERAFAYLRDHPDHAYFDEAGDLWWLSEPFPGGGRPAGRLGLRVTTARGASTFVPGYELERPPGWRPPYGLR